MVRNPLHSASDSLIFMTLELPTKGIKHNYLVQSLIFFKPLSAGDVLPLCTSSRL